MHYIEKYQSECEHTTEINKHDSYLTECSSTRMLVDTWKLTFLVVSIKR